jgi:hypothetical protein
VELWRGVAERVGKIIENLNLAARTARQSGSGKLLKT